MCTTEMMPSLSHRVVRIKGEIDRVRKLPLFLQAVQVWPILYDLWGVLSEVVAELDQLKKGAKNGT